MESSTRPRRDAADRRPRRWLEAFRITAAAERDGEVAVRTKGDEVSLTWGELRERVDALAGGLAKLGVKRGDTRRADARQPARVPPRRPRRR